MLNQASTKISVISLYSPISSSESELVTRPHATPATASLIGTPGTVFSYSSGIKTFRKKFQRYFRLPASINAILPPQTDAIDEDPSNIKKHSSLPLCGDHLCTISFGLTIKFYPVAIFGAVCFTLPSKSSTHKKFEMMRLAY